MPDKFKINNTKKKPKTQDYSNISQTGKDDLNSSSNKKVNETFETDYDRNSEMARERIKLNESILKYFKTISDELPSKYIEINDISAFHYLGLANRLLNYFRISQKEYIKYGINNEYAYIFDLINFFREANLTAEQFDEEIKWRQDFYRIEALLGFGISSTSIANWIKKQVNSNVYSNQMRYSKISRLLIAHNIFEYLRKNG